MKNILGKSLLLILILLPLQFHAQKAELVVQTGHSDDVRSIAFSPDGNLLASGGNDQTIKIWKIDSGRQLRTLNTDSSIDTVIFSPDGKFLASSGDNDGIRIWDAASGKLIKKLVGKKIYRDMAFSPDGKTLASCGFEFVTLWDVAAGKELRKIPAQTKEYVSSVAFSPDGKTLAASGWNAGVNLWNAETGEQIKEFPGAEYAAFAIVFSPDGKKLFTGNRDNSVKILDLETGDLQVLRGHENTVLSIAISPDGKRLASGSRDKSVKIWDTVTGTQMKTLLPSDKQVSSVSFSPDGKTVAAGSDKSVYLWNVETGKEVNELKSLAGLIETIEVSQAGNIFAASDWNKKISIWNPETGRKIQTLNDGEKIVQHLRFSPDERILVSVGWNSNVIKIWDVQTGVLLHSLTVQTDTMDSIDISPDSRTLISTSYNPDYTTTIQLWDLKSGKLIKTLASKGANLQATFSKDGTKIVTGTEHGTFIVWDVKTGKQLRIISSDDPQSYDTKIKPQIEVIAPNFIYRNQYLSSSTETKFELKKDTGGEMHLYRADGEKHLASLISLGENDWAVVTPEGLFDASPGARKLMHFAVGFETVALEQMKEIYYVPGLLKKIYDGEPLPAVELFSAEDLFPLAEYEIPKDGKKEFPVKITNRGGGIGQIQVLINGKEFLADARPDGFDPNQRTANLTINLENAPFVEGEGNKIEIVTRNADGSINSRGARRGTEILEVGKKSAAPPNVYLIVGGISNYTGDNLDLKFAAKDAADFANALEIGAAKLFGADKVHLRLLTSEADQANVKFISPDAKVSTATKADFIRAFEDFKRAQPNDIFIVYLAGHGVSLDSNQANGDTYLYLTQEATTTDKTVLSIENSRRAMTISSDELTELMKQNKALKQVLILDTCAAGAAAESLIAKRDLPSDQIRAIERLKDRTGFFVLMGAAANKVSYEATQYGQGLLTYSLLQGMKGARLRENQFADVNLLFSYAQDSVPEMAKNIGGIQRPLIIAPDTSASFDIGKFTAEEQSRIPLAAPKPLILKPVLQNRDLDYDDLELTPMLRQALRNSSFAAERGTSAIVFVEADEMVDAIKPSGSYTVRGDEINVTIRLIKNKKPVKTLTISGNANNKEELVKQIAEAINKGTPPV